MPNSPEQRFLIDRHEGQLLDDFGARRQPRLLSNLVLQFLSGICKGSFRVPLRKSRRVALRAPFRDLCRLLSGLQ